MHPHHHHGGGGGFNWGGWAWPQAEYVPYPVDYGDGSGAVPWEWVAIGALAGFVLAAITGRR